MKIENFKDIIDMQNTEKELFSNVFDLDEMQRIQDLFSDATGVASIITYPNGVPITKPSNFCQLCEIVRSTDKGLANCIKSDECAGRQLEKDKGLNLETCKSAGLLDTGAKIVYDDKHIANWMIGQVRSDTTDEQRIIDYADEIGVDKASYLEALKEVPVMTKSRFEKVADMLTAFINEMLEKTIQNKLLKMQIAELKQVNELLNKSEESLAITLNSIGDGVIATDKQGLIVNMNPIAENLCGWALNEASGKPLAEVFRIINSGTGILQENPVEKVLTSGEIIGLANHTVLISRNGQRYQIADSAAPIKTKDGEITGVVLVFSDVTEKYKAEIELKESERFLKETQSVAGLGTYTTDIINGHWESSEVLDTIFGIGSDDDRSVEGWLSIIHPDWKAQMSDYFTYEVIGKKKRFDKEYKIVRKSDKAERWVHGLGELVFDTNGNPVTMIGTIQDITERKESAEKIRLSEEKYREIFESVQDVFYKVDLSGKILDFSPSAKKYPDIFDFKSPQMYIHDLYFDINDRKKLLSLIYKDGEIHDYELDLKGKSNQIIHVSINAYLVKDSNGNPTHINGAIRDISKRKIAENALRESERFLKEIQTIAMIGNWTIDFAKNEWYSSEVLDEILGLNNNSSHNLNSLSGLLYSDWFDILSDYFQNEILPNKTHFDKKFEIVRQNDSSVRWVHAIGELKLDENNQPLVMIGTVQDITERKNTTEALRKSQEELKKFASHLQNVREEERNLLAREIHDDLGQILIAMKIDLGLLKQSVLKTVNEKDYQDVKTKFDNLYLMLDNTLKSARRIMTDLRPEVLDMLGFTDTVKQHLDNFQHRHKIQCLFETNAKDLNLDSQQTVALFRIVQEALNNVAKHSRATEVVIKVAEKKKNLTLEINDNGVGFDKDEKKSTESFGLMGMKERVFLLDGELTIYSERKTGTTIKVSMPYENAFVI